MLRWRSSTAVARRTLWAARLSSQALVTVAQAEQEATTDAPRKRVSTTTATKRASEKEARDFALLPSALHAFHKATGHFFVHYDLRVHVGLSDASSLVSRKESMTRRVEGGRICDASLIDWPEEVLHQDIKLGRVLHKFMVNEAHRLRHPQVVSQLRKIGFPLEAASKDWPLFIWNHRTIAALTNYKELQGDLMMANAFLVPHGDPQWPETLWGYPLGMRADKIRRTRHKLRDVQLADLAKLQFPFDLTQAKWDTLIVPSLQVYHSEHGHCRVPQKFVVPHRAPYPPKAWGIHLGQTAHDLRSKRVYADQATRDDARLKAWGFITCMSEYMWSERILPSLQVFFKIHGHCDVDQKFLVPSEDPWPQEAWREKLGSIVNRIRSQDEYAFQVSRDGEKLDEIGFVWYSAEYRWTNIILPSLEQFYEIYANTRIPWDFEVPAQAPWAKATWGLKLGTCIRNMHHHDNFAMQRARDHARLQAIGLVSSVSGTIDYYRAVV